MKAKLFFLLCIITLNSTAQSPSWKWAKSAVGLGVSGKQVINDSNGNTYVVGEFSCQTLNFDSITLTNAGNNYQDAFIVKYDAHGNALWAKSLGGSFTDAATSVAIDNSGNVYVTGYFYGTTLPFSGTILTTIGGADFFLLKYDSAGNLLWAKSAGGSADEKGMSLFSDFFGNLVVTGFFYSPTITFGTTVLTKDTTNNSAPDIFVVKYDNIGNVLWAQRAGGSGNDIGKSVSIDPFNNIFVAGYFSSPSITFGTTTLTNAGGNDVFIVKYNSVGNLLWAKSAGGISDDDIGSISSDASGNVIVTGMFKSPTIMFGTTTLTNAGSGTSDIFLAKYDVSGNVIWAKTAGDISDDEGRSVSIDTAGNIYMTGFFADTSIVFGNYTLTNTFNSNSFFYDIFIVKYSLSGNVVWAKSTGGNSDDVGNSVSVDVNGNVFVTGYFWSTTIPFGTSLLSYSNSSFFVAKLVDDVWPGDSDNNAIVNNNDLLPIGLYFGQTGAPRASISNVWQADSAVNWGITMSNGFDIKHVDCNGDGTIDVNDTLAINLNFNLTHAIPPYTDYTDERPAIPDIYFITSGNSYNAGDWVTAEVWLGNSTVPVSDLYGIAFNVSYSSLLVQSGTESITFPVSWLGTPGTNIIKIGKIDAFTNLVYGAETRIDHTNASGFGKIAEFKFQLKTTIASTSTMHFSISNYSGNNALGVSQEFNTINDSIIVNATTVGIIEENSTSEITISPNPFTSKTTIIFSQEQENCIIKIIDILGKEVKIISFTGKQLIMEKGEIQEGVYFVQVICNKTIINRKIVIQ